MAIGLGANQYGKAESRVVRIYRDTPRHQIRDLNVSPRLRGDFEDAPTSPATSATCCRPTRRRTPCSRSPRRRASAPIEDFALTLGGPLPRGVARRRRRADRGRGVRLGPDPGRRRGPRPLVRPDRRRHPHDGRQRRRSGRGPAGARRVRDQRPRRAQVDRLGVPRLPQGQVHDARRRPTTASSRPRWSPAGATTAPDVDWDKSYDVRSRRCCSSVSPRSTASRCSRRSTAWARPCSSSSRRSPRSGSSAPNKHHFLVDLSPFGVENPGEVFYRRGPAVRAHRGDRRCATTRPTPARRGTAPPASSDRIGRVCSSRLPQRRGLHTRRRGAAADCTLDEGVRARTAHSTNGSGGLGGGCVWERAQRHTGYGVMRRDGWRLTSL